MTHPSLHARTHPSKPAVVMAGSGESLSYEALDQQSNQGAQLFRSLGLQSGDHIAMLVDNCLQFHVLCWAAQRAGLYFTPISTRLRPAEVEYIVRDCDARLLVVSASLADCALALPPDLTPHRFALGGELKGWRQWDTETAAQPVTSITDEVMGYEMIYSSGTTGRPKGIVAPFGHERVDALTPVRTVIRDRYQVGPDSVYLSPAPCYHGGPMRFNMGVQALGGTTVIMERFDADDLLKYIAQYRITHAQLVPTMFVRMLKLPEAQRIRHDLRSLKYLIHAAAPCPMQVKEKMIEWFGPIVWEYYGGTEANGMTGLDSQEWLAHKGSVGRALYATPHIVSDDGRELAAGQVGNVYFSGGARFAYHKDAEKTRKAYDERGWSSLGDIGYLDAEGYLYLTDRKAFVIISGGVNIYPQETEDTLLSHPKVMDAAVFGVPNADLGEEVKAVVQPMDMRDAGPALEAELIAWCREHLSGFKCPLSVDFQADLPREPTGKLFKQPLKQRYWDQARAAAPGKDQGAA